MDTGSIDIQLLRVFEAMLLLRNTTKAAEHLGMSQPSVSYGLARLRQVLDDPLFTRIGHSMRPTPRALELAAPIRRILDTLDREVMAPARFDPAQAQREFALCMTDIGELHYIQDLMAAASQTAPGVTFRVVPVAHDRLDVALENGEVDLAVGYFPELSKDRLYQQLLSTSSFVCVARQGNPHVGRRLTLERYCSAPHVALSTQIRSLDVLDHYLRAKGYAARIQVRLRVAHILTLLNIVLNSDLVATVPLEAARHLTASGRVRAWPTPFDAPTFSLRQHWHERFHHDAANQWLRGLVKGIFGPPEARK